MRRLIRPNLAPSIERYLDKKQDQVDQGLDVTACWNNARKTRTMREVHGVLASMSGRRERCMFCEDSRGADIDHFQPKKRFPEKAFRWPNLLLLCSGCNRRKGDAFECDADGEPLLIDPTREDPWESLVYDSGTGNLAPRYLAEGASYHRKGEYTTRPDVLPLNDEAVSLGRMRTRRHLVRSVRAFLEASQGSDSTGALSELFQAVVDCDHHGLLAWFFEREGQEEQPFKTLRDQQPQIWSDLVRNVVRTTPASRPVEAGNS